MRIFFTGGQGKAGRLAVAHLRGLGHRVVNIDAQPGTGADDDALQVDLTDAGQVQNAMQAYAHFDELDAPGGMPAYDAVVHFAATPRILMYPDNETYRFNTLSTYNVIDAAIRAGIKKVIFASFETTYGILRTDGLGYEVFNVANDDSSVGMSSADILETFYRGVPVKTPITGHDTFYSNAKAKRMVGFAPKHGWRDQVGTAT
jgi:UDP-glucose 4-epimerase